MTGRYRVERRRPATAAGGEWRVQAGARYGYLPASAQISRAERLKSAAHLVKSAIWIMVKALVALIAIPLILIFVIASFGVMFFPGKW